MKSDRNITYFMIPITENDQQKKSAVLEMRLVIICCSEEEGGEWLWNGSKTTFCKVCTAPKNSKKSFNFAMKMFIINILSINTLYFILYFWVSKKY